MIVNVNPYDTGYHENSAVMEFSALASEISTVSTKPLQPALTRKVAPPAAPEPVELEKPATKPPTTRQVRLSIAGTAGAAPVDRLFEVVEGSFLHTVEVPLSHVAIMMLIPHIFFNRGGRTPDPGRRRRKRRGRGG